MKQTVLITGASSGIGRATAILLNEKGYNVYAAARRVEKMDDLEKQGIHVLPIDVANDTSIISALKTIKEEIGMVDILINNAGYGLFGSLEETPIYEARKHVNVNLMGLAKLTQMLLPAMREAGKGIIVNISSMGGKFGEPLGSWYHATKYAVEGLSESLFLEMKPFGVKVIIIEPGIIRTEWSGIALDHLIKMSGKGPYKEFAANSAKMLTKMNDPKTGGTEPEIIAKTIFKAIRAKKPKLRYAAGKGAKMAIFLRRFMSDGAYLRLLEKTMNKLANNSLVIL
ncbi:MAG: SDR family NAD(P)-dependent oxidoreductase [Dysgonamonadaceae bacterium]|jgi:short-subunit dehydrogenase|nr:SDR family NAD(P)-dependent oxidoreductase [Dysgonamonadaceae bacterium]